MSFSYFDAINYMEQLPCFNSQKCDLNLHSYRDLIIKPLVELCHKHPYDFNFTYSVGTTKLVLFFDDANFVVKIPLRGYNTNADFLFAGGAGSTWNYCGVEAELYTKAKAENISQFFAETYLLAEIGESKYPIYVQEKVNDFWDYYYYTPIACPAKNAKEINEICTKLQLDTLLRREWLNDVLKKSNKNILTKFLFFVKENSINDLHEDNIGWTMSGMPVLFDFSGFSE